MLYSWWDCLYSFIGEKFSLMTAFYLVSFVQSKYDVKLGLIVCLIKCTQSWGWSSRKRVQLHLLDGYSHILLVSSPSNFNIFTTLSGIFRCWWTNSFKGQDGGWYYNGPSIYIADEFIAYCSGKTAHEGHTLVTFHEYFWFWNKALHFPFSCQFFKFQLLGIFDVNKFI